MEAFLKLKESDRSTRIQMLEVHKEKVQPCWQSRINYTQHDIVWRRLVCDLKVIATAHLSVGMIFHLKAHWQQVRWNSLIETQRRQSHEIDSSFLAQDDHKTNRPMTLCSGVSSTPNACPSQYSSSFFLDLQASCSTIIFYIHYYMNIFDRGNECSRTDYFHIFMVLSSKIFKSTFFVNHLMKLVQLLLR